MKTKQRHILSLLENKTSSFENKIALGIKDAYGWKEFTYKGLGLMSRRLARYMIEDLGVEKEQKLAILSESKPEYGAGVFASVLAGLVTVPLDIKLTKYELKSILLDAQPTVFLASQTYVEMAKDLQKVIPSITHIIVIDEHGESEDITNIYKLPEKSNAKWVRRSPQSTALIIYTSGTTGAPKGVEISFSNVTAQLEDLKYALDAILPQKEVTVLSILPMNHLLTYKPPKFCYNNNRFYK